MENETEKEELTRLRIEKEIFEQGDSRWASKLAEFLIYGLAGLILVGAIGAMLSLIYIHNTSQPTICNTKCP